MTLPPHLTPAHGRVLDYLRANPGGRTLREVARAAGVSQVEAERLLWDLTGAGLVTEVRGEGILWLRLWAA